MPPAEPSSEHRPEDRLDPLCRRIEEQLALISPRPGAVADACAALDQDLLAAADPPRADAVARRLARLLHTCRGDGATTLFDWLLPKLTHTDDPSGLAAELLAAREPALQRRAMDEVVDCWERRELTLPPALARQLAAAARSADDDDITTADLARLREIAAWLGRRVEDADSWTDPREALLCNGQGEELRQLAARALDGAGIPVPEARLVRVLGAEAADRLGGLLQYTRATHRDLVDLTPDGPLSDDLVEQLCEAKRALGPTALGAVIGALGWSAVSRGIMVEHRLGVSVDGSYPFLVTPEEADLLAACGTVRQVWDRSLVVAHGATRGASVDSDGETDEVRRFRRYNLLHAELLGEILEIAPVTPAKVRRIIADLDEVVDIFTELFGSHLDDPEQAQRRYAELKAPLLAGLDAVPDDQPLNAEITRLVQMFEDPRNLSEVTTLHGLKRYLHQHGLTLAFRRFRSGNAANRTVDLVMVAGDRVVQVLRKIRYIDFEPPAGPTVIPFVVSLAVEALGRRLFHLQDDGPDLELLIYGNEVQAYVRFRNHPAFLRIDCSPPLRGGMIDLVYFGVSQYELDHHPDLRLLWIQRIFRRLDFDAQADGLRLHIRYDKERAFDFTDLVDHVRLLCSLLPHLMDLDWVLGGLRYPEPVLAAVADHWADWIVNWGVLPLDDMLTADRRALSLGVRTDASGTAVVPWDGQGEVRHRLSGGPGPAFWSRLREAMSAHDPSPPGRWAAARNAVPAQLTLQSYVLDPRREARALRASAVPDTTDAPVRFAAMLDGAGDDLEPAARTAAVVTSVERHLRFGTVGTVHGYPVQQAALRLPGEVLDIRVLRDRTGTARLATARTRPFLLTPGSPGPDADAARLGQKISADDLAIRLRLGNYVGITSEILRPADGIDRSGLIEAFAVENPQAPPPRYPGDRTLDGVTAAPGRATGTAVFYRADLTPADVEGAVLFAPALRPEDTPLLSRVAAVVSTGGGILSHAGMIAQERGKPALVVQGEWRLGAASRAELVCRTTDHDEEVCRHGAHSITRYRDRREREERLREGDLVVVDADRGKLGILGQDRDALAMQEELRRHDAVAEALELARPGQDELSLRGRLLRAVHQMEKLVARIEQPNLARHAARELLAPRQADPPVGGRRTPTRSRRSGLLRRLLANPTCGMVAREAAISEEASLARHLRSQCALSQQALDDAETLHEVLFLQLSVQRAESRLLEMRQALAAAGVPAGECPTPTCDILDEQCRRRLLALRERCLTSLAAQANQPDRWWRTRSLLEEHANLVDLLGKQGDGPAEGALRDRVRVAATAEARRAVATLAGRRIIRPDAGGRELATVIGAKGAGLGEIARVLGPSAVPPWFAVSDAVFREALATGIGPVDSSLKLARGTPVAVAIVDLLRRGDLDAPARSAAIRSVWQSLNLPDDLSQEIRRAYLELGADLGDDPSRLAVAVRSSTFEEDSTRSSWAGQFDTFLGIRGVDAVLDHIKLAWASLWSERVLHHRRGLGSSEAVEDLGGGVLVQRLIDSRAAGVAHTLSPVSGQPREMVVNVGLGLGEGVVSGTVEVDQVTIDRTPGEMPEMLSFRYSMADKRHQVVFDRCHGRGTCIEETLYHQRLRPALEYTDLQDLVRAATRLEASFGHPLDVEFALAGDRLYILQARPIVAFQVALQATLERRKQGRPSTPTGP